MTYGIDVSHFQSTIAPGGMPWSLLAQSARFVIVRATYGTYRDPSAVPHVRAARAVGMKVGLYHFFRSTQPVGDQLAAFCAQALACGLNVGDICPALDIEDDPNVASVVPGWDTALQAMASGLVANFGECLMYVTQRDFGRLGSPDWLLEHPLWTAHYTGAPKPATPGNRPCVIWQHRVGPYQADGQGGAFKPMVLDQNRALGALPLCTRVAGASGSTPPPPDGPAPDHSHEDLSDLRVDVYAWREAHGLDVLTGLPSNQGSRDE
jgi:lysozyme